MCYHTYQLKALAEERRAQAARREEETEDEIRTDDVEEGVTEEHSPEKRTKPQPVGFA